MTDVIQLSIFDIAPEPSFPETAEAYRLTDPDTSQKAAQDASHVAGRGRQLALQTLAKHPDGLTDFELADATGWQQTSIGKRRHELMKMSLVEMATVEVEKVAVIVKRPAPSGSASIVWRLTDQGRDYVKENYHA